MTRDDITALRMWFCAFALTFIGWAAFIGWIVS